MSGKEGSGSIRYHEIADRTAVLGPGQRFVLWVSGCCFDCEGCIAGSYRNFNSKRINSDKMAEYILSLPELDGLTISGGEPFLQSRELWRLVQSVKAERSLDVIVYTGFLLEELRLRKGDAKRCISGEELEFVEPFLNQIDVLIDGRYQAELDDGRSLIGSSNQRVHNLSGYYSNEMLDQVYGQYQRKVEIVVKDKKTLLIGVPNRQQHKLWNNLKREVLT